MFGGFTSLAWKSEEWGKEGWDPYDPNAAIFSLNKRTVHFQRKNRDKQSVVLAKHKLSWFWCDIEISSKFTPDNRAIGASWFGSQYKLPRELNYDNEDRFSYLAGKKNFEVLELEVYSLIP